MISLDFLSTLHCPYCGSGFDLEWQIPQPQPYPVWNHSLHLLPISDYRRHRHPAAALWICRILLIKQYLSGGRRFRESASLCLLLCLSYPSDRAAGSAQSILCPSGAACRIAFVE